MGKNLLISRMAYVQKNGAKEVPPVNTPVIVEKSVTPSFFRNINSGAVIF